MKSTENQIFTIGHGNRTMEIFINLLLQSKIKLLVDVRSIPYSRFNPQYRQANLINSLDEFGIGYIWLGKELGGRPKDDTLYIEGKPNYSAMRETDNFKSGISKVLELVMSDFKVTLMCSENDPNECHRKLLIADELLKSSISILHINKVGNLELHQLQQPLFD